MSERTLRDLIAEPQAAPPPAKLKDFVATARAKGVPDDEIAAHLSASPKAQAIFAELARGGVSQSEIFDHLGLKAPEVSWGGGLRAGGGQGFKDVAQTIMGGLHRGAEWMAPQTMQAVEQATGLGTAQQHTDAYNAQRNVFDADYGDSVAGNIGRIGGQVVTAAPLVEPLIGSALGAGVDALGTSAAGRLISGGGANLVSRIVGGGVRGAGYTAASSASSDQPVEDQIETGGAVGAALPAAGALFTRGGRGVLNALVPAAGVDQETAELAREAYRLGVPIRPGQIAPQGLVNVADNVFSRMPFTGYAENVADQHTGFNRAVSRTFGEGAPGVARSGAPKITPAVMSRARARISGMFEDVLGRNDLELTPDLQARLGQVAGNAVDAFTNPNRANEITETVNRLMAKAVNNGGRITGRQYQNLVQMGGGISTLLNSADPTVQHYGGAIKEMLDDAFQSQMTDPADAQLFSDARHFWKNLKVVEPLAEKAPTGDISPALLQGRVAAAYDNYAYDGGGDIGNLAKIGQRFLKEPANSGTPERSFVMGGMTIGGALLSLPATAASIAGLGVAGQAFNRAVNSQWMQNRLTRAALARTAAPAALPRRAAGRYALPPAILGTNRLLAAPQPQPAD